MFDKTLCGRWPKDIVFKPEMTFINNLIPEAFERGFEAILINTCAALAESQLERWANYGNGD